MQVAVTLAVRACGGAPREHRRQARALPLGPGAQQLELALPARPEIAGELVDVAQRRRARVRVGGAMPRTGGRPAVEARKRGAELGERRFRQALRREPPVEPIGRGELAHLHGVLERRLAPDSRRRRRAADRHDAEIELRREPPIHAQLLVAEALAKLQRAEVDERQLDGLLDLVGVAPRQEHPRDVGLDELDLADAGAVTARIAQRRRQRRACRPLGAACALARHACA